MGEVKQIGIGTLQKGSYCVIDGAACKVVDIQISRPGKHGHAKSRVSAVGILDDKKRVFVAPSHDNIDTPIVEKRTAQVLSINGNMANVMDIETFETFDLKIEDELKAECVEGCNVLYWLVLDIKVMKQVKSS